MAEHRGIRTFFTQFLGVLVPGTILLDTVCLSEAARKTTAKDRDVVARLQALLPELTMDEVFKSLNKAKTNIAGDLEWHRY